MPYSSLSDWRKAIYGSQARLAEAIGRDQHMISRYERGKSITQEILKKIRQLGYDGPLEAEGEEVKPALKEMPLGQLLDETHAVIEEMRVLGLKQKSPELEREIQKRTAQEVQKAYTLGQYGSAKEFAGFLWSLRQVLR